MTLRTVARTYADAAAKQVANSFWESSGLAMSAESMKRLEAIVSSGIERAILLNLPAAPPERPGCPPLQFPNMALSPTSGISALGMHAENPLDAQCQSHDASCLQAWGKI